MVTITSPNFPNNYPSNTECEWDINVEMGYIVKLQFNSTVFSLQGGDCSRDYVEIRDVLANGTRVLRGKWCSTTAPPLITSTTHRIIVKFHSDGSTSGMGFAANWTTDCGGLFTDTSGVIMSPGYPNNYRHNLRCNYTIVSDPEHYVMLSFDNNYRLEGGNNCPFDYIRVFGGNSSSAAQLGRFCGRTVPQPVHSLGSMYIQFWTDRSISAIGFKAYYRTEACGGVYTAQTGVVRTPTYPNPYGHNSNCTWSITVNQTNIIALKFTAFQIEAHSSCMYDYVDVYDGNSLSSRRIGRYCGMTPPDIIKTRGVLGRSVHYCGSSVPDTFDSIGRVVQVNYNVPGASSSRGFLLSYMWADCNKNYASGYGRITSPGYPGLYPRNVNCTSMVTAPAGTTLALYFTAFYIEPHSSCAYDYLEIRNGTSSGSVISRLCGATIPDPVFVPSNVAYLNFKTDSSVAHIGYDISYTSTNQGLGCGGQLSGINGSFTSPGFPGNYSDVATCTWSISVPARRVIRLTFTYMAVLGEADCDNNYVEVFDGPNTLSRTFGRFCDTQPAVLTSSSNTATVRLVSTGSSPAPSFRIIYTS
nr:hypothetical protein BaRGS_007979 [Batillaria attramentaria]